MQRRGLNIFYVSADAMKEMTGSISQEQTGGRGL